MIKQKAIRELFTYKPPKSEEDKLAYELVNNLCIEFANGLSELIEDPAELTILLRKIQEVRMLSNQAICYQQNNISYKGVFVPISGNANQT